MCFKSPRLLRLLTISTCSQAISIGVSYPTYCSPTGTCSWYIIIGMSYPTHCSRNVTTLNQTMKNWNDVAKGQLVICFTVREVKQIHTTEILDKTSWWLVYIYKFLHAEVISFIYHHETQNHYHSRHHHHVSKSQHSLYLRKTYFSLMNDDISVHFPVIQEFLG